jgi:hypothetical protein
VIKLKSYAKNINRKPHASFIMKELKQFKNTGIRTERFWIINNVINYILFRMADPALQRILIHVFPEKKMRGL